MEKCGEVMTDFTDITKKLREQLTQAQQDIRDQHEHLEYIFDLLDDYTNIKDCDSCVGEIEKFKREWMNPKPADYAEDEEENL